MSITDLLRASNANIGGTTSSSNTGISALLKASNAKDGLAYIPQNTTQSVPKPTLGSKVLSVGKALVKGAISAPVTLMARPAQMIAGLAGATPEQQDAMYKSWGGIVAPVARNNGDIMKDVGRGIQTVSYGGVPGISSALGEATLGGAAFGLGSSMEQGNPVLSGETLKQTALGAGIGAAAHGLIAGGSKLLSKAEPAIAPAVEGTVAKEVAPTIAKTLELNAPTLKLESPVVAAGKRALADMPKVTEPVTNTIYDRAKAFSAKENFIRAETSGVGSVKEMPHLGEGIPSKTPTRTQLGKIWEDAHSTEPIQMGSIAHKNPIPVAESAQTNGQTIPLPSTPEVSPIQPVSKPIIPDTPDFLQKNVSMLENIKNTPESTLKVPSTTLAKQSAEASAWIDSVGYEKARRVALGIDEAPSGVDIGAIHSAMANYANDTGNGALQLELAQSNVLKVQAQNIGAGRIKDPGNSYYALKDIINSLEKNQPSLVKTNTTAEKLSILGKIKGAIENSKLSGENIILAAKSLIC